MTSKDVDSVEIASCDEPAIEEYIGLMASMEKRIANEGLRATTQMLAARVKMVTTNLLAEAPIEAMTIDALAKCLWGEFVAEGARIISEIQAFSDAAARGEEFSRSHVQEMQDKATEDLCELSSTVLALAVLQSIAGAIVVEKQ